MARNKNPEKTVSLILDVSMNLFCEKGYEKTTIQDIVDNLNGLSKGAVYHHFKSKEEIFEAVTNRSFNATTNYSDIVARIDLNGLEKLKLLLNRNSSVNQNPELLKNIKLYFKNSKFLKKYIQDNISESAPLIQVVIEEAVNDGSIVTEYPQEVAELVAFLFNIWSSPFIFDMTKDEYVKKLRLLMTIFDSLNIPLIDEEILRNLISHLSDLFVE